MIEKRAETVYALADLAQHNDLIAVDGIVYDVVELAKQHPGGDIICMLAGIDATLHYRTTHPWHNNKHWYWLQQFRVGKLAEYVKQQHDNDDDTPVLSDMSNTLTKRTNGKPAKSLTDQVTPTYASGTDIVNCWDSSNTKYDLNTAFAQELKQSVHKYFTDRNLSPDATYGWYARAFCFLAFYGITEYMWITGPSITIGLMSAVAMTFLGMNVPHEANHGSINYRYPVVNDALGWGMDIMGQSRYLWLQVHNYSHHIFVNETACDHDTTSGEPFISFDIEHNMSIAATSDKWWWRTARSVPGGKLAMSIFFLQFYRILMVLDVSAIYYMYKYDGQQDINVDGKARRIPRPNVWLMHWSRRWLSLAVHVAHVMWSYIPLVLMVYHNHSLNNIIYTLACWYVRDAGVSLGLSLNFLVSHNFEDVTRTIDNVGKPIDWYKMSIESSSNYGDTLEIMMTGGLCHQIEHHIFPKVNSAHYPAIKPIIRRVCEKHGVKYVQFDNAIVNLASMFRYIGSIH